MPFMIDLDVALARAASPSVGLAPRPTARATETVITNFDAISHSSVSNGLSLWVLPVKCPGEPITKASLLESTLRMARPDL